MLASFLAPCEPSLSLACSAPFERSVQPLQAQDLKIVNQNKFQGLTVLCEVRSPWSLGQTLSCSRVQGTQEAAHFETRHTKMEASQLYSLCRRWPLLSNAAQRPDFGSDARLNAIHGMLSIGLNAAYSLRDAGMQGCV